MDGICADGCETICAVYIRGTNQLCTQIYFYISSLAVNDISFLMFFFFMDLKTNSQKNNRTI